MMQKGNKQAQISQKSLRVAAQKTEKLYPHLELHPNCCCVQSDDNLRICKFISIYFGVLLNVSCSGRCRKKKATTTTLLKDYENKKKTKKSNDSTQVTKTIWMKEKKRKV